MGNQAAKNTQPQPTQTAKTAKTPPPQPTE